MKAATTTPTRVNRCTPNEGVTWSSCSTRSLALSSGSNKSMFSRTLKGFSGSVESVMTAACSRAFLAETSTLFWATKSGNCFVNRWFSALFHSLLERASLFLTLSLVVIDPVVDSSPVMKLRSPVKIVATLHAGFQVSGW